MIFTLGDSEEMDEKMKGVLFLSIEQLVDTGCKLREAVLKRRFDKELIK